MAFVSVIITVYNRVQYIYDAIDSVLNQTYQNYEIIVVNDGSTTDVKQALEPYMNGIKYLYQENKGLAAARNYGIKNSSGNYLAFLDDDDLFEPRKLEIQVQLLENSPEIGFVYSDCFEFDANNKTELRLNLAVGRDKPGTDFAKLFFMDPNVRVPALLIRRKCFEEVGLFDESLLMHEDGDMLLRIAVHWQVKFSDYPSARVRHHLNNMSQNRIIMYESIIKSSEKILTLYPEFRNSLVNADDKLSELYFQLGTAYLNKKMIRNSLIKYKFSRKLSKKYVDIRIIWTLPLTILSNKIYQIKEKKAKHPAFNETDCVLTTQKR